MITRAAINLALATVAAVLLFTVGGKLWLDNSSLQVGAYTAAVETFVPRLLDIQHPIADGYAFASPSDCDIRHEGRYHIVMGTVTVREFGENVQTNNFISMVSFDPVAKRWSDLGTRVLDQ